MTRIIVHIHYCSEVSAEADAHQTREADGFSDEEESEVSFEEGTYDGRHGDVSYHCDTGKIVEQSAMSQAKSQEE